MLPKRQYITRSWLDMVKREKKDTRTPDQIALDIIQGAGLTFKQKSADGMDGENE